MSIRAVLDATVGRRLVTRIWAHGLLLFAGVLATFVIGRELMRAHEEATVMRLHPYVAMSVADRVLAQRDAPEGLAREVRRAAVETPLALSVFSGDGALLATSVEPALAAPTDDERGAFTRATDPSWRRGRLVAARLEDGRVTAMVVMSLPQRPSVPWHVVALLTAALILGFVFVAWPLSHAIARPIAQLGRLARQLGDGDLGVRTGSRRRDEIGDLARSFDTMAGQLQNLRASERQLLGDVSHELRTPLARMRVVLDLATDAREIDRVRAYLAEITADLAELEQLIDDIIVHSRLDPAAGRWDEARPPIRRRRTSIDELVDASVARFRSRWPDRVLDADRPAAPVEINGDPTMLRRVLDNLLDNARKYSADHAPIAIRIAPEPVRDRVGVRIEIVDRGIGIPAEDHARVFSPFFRADRSRTRASGGVGLGLALSRRIIDAHGGTIGFDSADHGSRFWFVLEVAAHL